MLTAAEPARRIDRLARGAHRFHRFAHHPLCDAYAGEVIRVGRRVRLCRGCSCVAAGAVAGILIAVAIPPLPVLVQAMLLAASVLVAGASLVRRQDAGSSRGRPQRSSKLVTRGLPSVILLASVIGGARAGGRAGWLLSAGAIIVVGAAVAAYRRRGPERTPCGGCSERAARICSGFRPIARREAAFARMASRLLPR